LKFDYNIELKIHKESDLQSRETDTLAIVSGNYRDMKSCIPKVIKNLEECMVKSECSNSSIVKIQIPTSMSHKIIGPKGNMVREIYQRSEGARIKILSDRESEKRLKNTILTIEGSLPSR